MKTFNIKTPITIRGQQYEFVPDKKLQPLMNGTGARASIYKLKHRLSNDTFALKVFKPEFQDAYPSQNFEFFQQNLPSIPAFRWVKHRILINPNTDAMLIEQYPQLRNAILMPWLELQSLDGIRADLKGKPATYTSSQKCRTLAKVLADTLCKLEVAEIAHGDIANSNMLVDWNNEELYLIDIEDMFHPSLPKPATIADSKGGTEGYRFHDMYASWCREADRFAGAILISELLTLDQEDSQEVSAEESFFTQDDLDDREYNGPNIPRYKIIINDMQQLTHGMELTKLIQAAWQAKTIGDAPRITEWHKILGEPEYSQRYKRWEKVPASHTLPIPSTLITNPIKPRRIVTPYDRRADSDSPALIIFLLDLSRSMFIFTTVDEQIRFQIALNVINETIQELIQRCRKSFGIRPRYHVAVFGYHQNTIDLLTPHAQRVAGENNTHCPANVAQGIHPIGALEELTFDIASIAKITPIGKTEEEHPLGVTHMTQAFAHIHRLLKQNIQTYQNSHPPFIFHITDGANTDGLNVVEQFKALTSMSTDYGNVLVSTAYVADNLLSTPISQKWPGIDDTTTFDTERANIASELRKISSRIPAKYLAYLHQKQYTRFSPNSYLFFPGTDSTMMHLAMTITKSTGE